MAFRFLSLFAAVVLLAACETPSDQTGTASGQGAAGKTSSVDQGAAGTGTTTTTAPPKRPLSTILTVDVGDRVFFAFDKYSLKAKARQTLERQATFLKNNAGVKVVLQGHADERGTREYNLALGERRANSAKEYLIALGVNPNRITIISYGKERPAVAGGYRPRHRGWPYVPSWHGPRHPDGPALANASASLVPILGINKAPAQPEGSPQTSQPGRRRNSVDYRVGGYLQLLAAGTF